MNYANAVLNRLGALCLLAVILLITVAVLRQKTESPEVEKQVIAIAIDDFRPSEAFLKLGRIHDVRWTYIGSCGISGETLHDDNLRQVSLGADVVDDQLVDSRRYFEFCVDRSGRVLIPKDAAAREAMDP